MAAGKPLGLSGLGGRGPGIFLWGAGALGSSWTEIFRGSQDFVEDGGCSCSRELPWASPPGAQLRSLAALQGLDA